MKSTKVGLLLLMLLASFPAFSDPLPCTSFNGAQVPYIANPILNDVGVAHATQYGQPVIQINPNVIGPLPEYVRQFWYAHECAHHALRPAENSEVNADCWAIKTIRNIGIINHQQQIDNLLNYISQLPGNIQTGHLPGPSRAQNLYECFFSIP